MSIENKIVNIIRKHMNNKMVDCYYDDDRKMIEYFFVKNNVIISDTEYEIYNPYLWKLWDLINEYRK